MFNAVWPTLGYGLTLLSTTRVSLKMSNVNIASFNVWARYFVWNFKGTFEIPFKIFFLYIEKCRFYSQVKITELLEIKAHKCFETAPRSQQNTTKHNLVIGRIRLSVSTINRTYELSGITHVTPFRRYGKHSTGSSTYGPRVHTYTKLFSCKSVLTVCSYRAQSNEFCTYGRVSRGSLPGVSSESS